MVAIGNRGGVNDVLGEHHFCFINLKVSEVLTIVGLGSRLVFFIVLPFSAITILVSCFVTVTAGFGSAISEGRSIGFALAFRSTFVTFPCPFSFRRAVTFGATGVGARGVASPAFTFFTFVAPPTIIGRRGVVGHG